MSVIGIEDFRAAMKSLPDLLKRKVLRKALTDAAAPVLAAAQAAAPVLSADGARRAPYRRPGTLKNALAIRNSKQAAQEGNVGVFVNVRPLPGNQFSRVRVTNFKGGKRTKYVLRSKSQRSSRNPNDPFYWFFVLRGTSKMAKRDFFTPGVQQFKAALEIFQRDLAAAFETINNGGASSL